METEGTQGETDEINDDEAIAIAQERRRNEAACKVTEALKSAAQTQEATKAHEATPTYTSDFAKQIMSQTDLMEVQISTEQLEAHMDFITKKLAQNKRERKKAALDSKDPNSKASGP